VAVREHAGGVVEGVRGGAYLYGHRISLSWKDISGCDKSRKRPAVIGG
jgi:hypothetical protein